MHKRPDREVGLFSSLWLTYMKVGGRRLEACDTDISLSKADKQKYLVILQKTVGL